MKRLHLLLVVALIVAGWVQLGWAQSPPQSAEEYIASQYGILSDSAFSEFNADAGRFVATNVSVGNTLEAIVVLQTPNGVSTVLHLDRAVYDIENPSHHSDAYRRYFSELELLDSNADGVPELYAVSGCGCSPGIVFHLLIDLESFDALSAGVLAWYDELPSGETLGYVPLVEPLTFESDRIATMQEALIVRLQQARFAATLDESEAYPEGNVLPLEVGSIRPADVQGDAGNVCVRLGISTVSQIYKDSLANALPENVMCQPQQVISDVLHLAQSIHDESAHSDENLFAFIVPMVELEVGLTIYLDSLRALPEMQDDPEWQNAFIELPFSSQSKALWRTFANFDLMSRADTVKLAQDLYVAEQLCTSAVYTARPSWCYTAQQLNLFEFIKGSAAETAEQIGAADAVAQPPTAPPPSTNQARTTFGAALPDDARRADTDQCATVFYSIGIEPLGLLECYGFTGTLNANARLIRNSMQDLGYSLMDDHRYDNRGLRIEEQRWIRGNAIIFAVVLEVSGEFQGMVIFEQP